MNLPDWLQPLLPDPTEPLRISYKNDEVIITDPDTQEVRRFTVKEPAGLSVIEDSIRHKDIKLEDSFVEAFSDTTKDFDLGVFYPIENSKFLRMLFSYDDGNRLKSLEDDFEEFKEQYKEYEDNPANFRSAFYFIDTHPAFWVKSKNVEKTWYWHTFGHCQKINLQVLMGTPEDDSDVSSYSVLLSTGSHTNQGNRQYYEHYYDHELECIGDSYEEAIIELASRVYKKFNVDGSERNPGEQ